MTLSTWEWFPTHSNILENHRADRCITKALVGSQGVWALSAQRKSIPLLTRSFIQKLITRGKIIQNGQAISPSNPLFPDKIVTIYLDDPEIHEITAEDRIIEILFEDDDIAVLNKPADLTVHPSETQKSGTLVHALVGKLPNLSGVGGILRPGIVHRLDKNTSGVMIVSKSDKAHIKLVEIFKKHEITRKYWAICYGNLSAQLKSPLLLPSADVEYPLYVSSLIGRSIKDRKKMSIEVKAGKTAKTLLKPLQFFRVSGRQIFCSLVEAKLLTGRTHQVRVHLASLGHSILGDSSYGLPTQSHSKWKALPAIIQDLALQLSGQALHAKALGFNHPITNQPMYFEAPPPILYRDLLDALEKFKVEE